MDNQSLITRTQISTNTNKRKLRKLSKPLVIFKNKQEYLKGMIKLRVILLIIKIQCVYKSYQTRKSLRRKFLINKLLRERRIAADIIKSKIRSFILVKAYNTILNKEKGTYVITYLDPIADQSVQIYIKTTISGFAKFDLEYCKFRKIYVCYIPTSKLNPIPYLSYFSINNIKVIDPRYKTVFFGKEFFNKIDFSDMKKDGPDQTENSKFFNLKNIELYRCKVNEEIEEEISSIKSSRGDMTKGFGSRNISLTNIRIKIQNEIRSIKSLNSLNAHNTNKQIKPILKKNNKKILIGDNDSLAENSRINNKLFGSMISLKSRKRLIDDENLLTPTNGSSLSNLLNKNGKSRDLNKRYTNGKKSLGKSRFKSDVSLDIAAESMAVKRVQFSNRPEFFSRFTEV